MDLGRKEKPLSLAEPAQAQDKEPKISYPEFTVRDEAAEKLLADYPCEVGEEVAATVRLKVSGRREDEYGKTVSFDVIEMEDMAEESEEKAGAGESDEPDDEEKVLGYKRKKTTKEEPAMAAKDLVE